MLHQAYDLNVKVSLHTTFFLALGITVSETLSPELCRRSFVKSQTNRVFWTYWS